MQYLLTEQEYKDAPNSYTHRVVAKRLRHIFLQAKRMACVQLSPDEVKVIESQDSLTRHPLENSLRIRHLESCRECPLYAIYEEIDRRLSDKIHRPTAKEHLCPNMEI